MPNSVSGYTWEGLQHQTVPDFPLAEPAYSYKTTYYAVPRHVPRNIVNTSEGLISYRIKKVSSRVGHSLYQRVSEPAD